MKKSGKTIQTTEEHKKLRDDFLLALKKHDHLDPIHMLAMASNLVGQLIAMQDQRKYSIDNIWAIVGANIEIGNHDALHTIFGETKGTA